MLHNKAMAVREHVARVLALTTLFTTCSTALDTASANPASKARLLHVDLLPGQSYRVTGAAKFGAVVIWLSGSGVCGESSETSSRVGRVIKSDDPCLVPNGGAKVFRNTTDRAIPMTIVEVLQQDQPLTVLKGVLKPLAELVDASERNYTLLIALTPLRLRAVRESTETSGATSTKTKILQLGAKDTFWLEPGIYSLTNMLHRKCLFVTVEW